MCSRCVDVDADCEQGDEKYTARSPDWHWSSCVSIRNYEQVRLLTVLITADGTANSKLAREFSERKAKMCLKLNCSLSPDFSVQLNVSLSERLSSLTFRSVKDLAAG